MTKTILTFDESTVEEVLDVFGWVVGDAGYIATPKGGCADCYGSVRVTAADGKKIQASECAGIVMAAGEPTPLRSDLESLIDHVKSRVKTMEGSE